MAQSYTKMAALDAVSQTC